MKSFLTRTIVLFIFLGCAGPQVKYEDISGSEIIEYGICTLDQINKFSSKTAATGKYTLTKDVTFKEKTTEIPAKLKTSFGIRYVVNGNPEGKEIKVLFRVTHPAINGKTVSSIPVKVKFGTPHANFYSFDRPNELLIGKWTFDVLFKDRLLARQEFMIIEK